MIIPYASSSKGNVFEVNDGQTRLLLECGLSYKRIQGLTGHALAGITGVLITHEHMDHAKAAKEMHRRGMDIYATAGTLGALGLDGHNAHPIIPLQQVQIGSLIVLPFPVRHDAADPVGYLLFSTATGEKAVMATDTYVIDYRFSGCTEIAIECNYCDALMDEAHIPDALKRRIRRNHLSLEACKDFLRASDLSMVNRIYLIHLSDDRSDAARFRREIQALTGREVVIA